MRKIIVLDEYFPTGEITAQPVLIWGPGRGQQDFSRITKTASEALEHIKHVVPEPGKTHMLVLALGSEEAYGPNRNGDGFPERPIAAKNGGNGHWISPGEELTKHYKSFETNPAHCFLHHVNKDPAKGSGHVQKAFWNDRMHRVELLIVIDNQKDPEWVQRVNDGDFPAVSMGCRIKYDVCSRCGNKAPTRAQYCDHVKFSMNQVNADGSKNYVHNPSPSFFDISRVFRPADRTGYTLKKVADVYEVQSSAKLGETADALARKSAAIRKLSDIEKIIRGEPVASSSNLSQKEQMLVKNFHTYAEPRLGESPALPMEELHKHSAAAVLSTLAGLGIMFKDAEFIEFMASKMAGRVLRLPSDITDKVAALMPRVYDLFDASPALCSEIISAGALNESVEKISRVLATQLAPYRVKRASVGEMLYRRMVPDSSGFREEGAPTTDLFTYNDPNTGNTFQATRGSALDARDAITRAHIRKILGGSALLLGGYKLLSLSPLLSPFKLPLTVGGGVLGYNARSSSWYQPTDITTDEGLAIPSITEFGPYPKTAAEDTTPIVVNLIEEYRRLGREKIAQVIRTSTAVDSVKNGGVVDSVKGLELDADHVAEVLGAAILA